MIRGNPLFRRHVTEHRALLGIFSSHRLKHNDVVLSSLVTPHPNYFFTILLGFSVFYFFGGRINLVSITALVVVPIFSIAFFALLPLVLIRGARSLNCPHLYQFSGEGIRLTGPGFDNRVEWKLVTRCYGFKQGLLFASGNAPLITVPARSLSAATRAKLRQLIMESGVELMGEWKKEEVTPATF